jgi:TatD DNase family protein
VKIEKLFKYSKFVSFYTNFMLIDIHTHQKNKAGTYIWNGLPNSGETVFFSAGIHPWDAQHFSDNSAQLEAALSHKNCLALGEIGLDKSTGPTREIQEIAFRKQIALSEQFSLPVIIHCVKSWNELRQLKKELQPTQAWIFHGFSKATLLEEVLHEGIYISIGAAVLLQPKLQGIIEQIPTSQLFLETDDANVSIFDIYQKVSELKHLPLLELEERIEENCKRVFTKWKIG